MFWVMVKTASAIFGNLRNLGATVCVPLAAGRHGVRHALRQHVQSTAHVVHALHARDGQLLQVRQRQELEGVRGGEAGQGVALVQPDRAVDVVVRHAGRDLRLASGWLMQADAAACLLEWDHVKYAWKLRDRPQKSRFGPENLINRPLQGAKVDQEVVHDGPNLVATRAVARLRAQVHQVALELPVVLAAYGLAERSTRQTIGAASCPYRFRMVSLGFSAFFFEVSPPEKLTEKLKSSLNSPMSEGKTIEHQRRGADGVLEHLAIILKVGTPSMRFAAKCG